MEPSMAFTKQHQSTISNMTNTTTASKSKGGGHTRLCVHTCLACVVLALYALNQRGMATEGPTAPTTPATLLIDTDASSSSSSSFVPSPVSIISTRQKETLLVQEGLSLHAKEVLLSAAQKRSGKSEASTIVSRVHTHEDTAKPALLKHQLPPLESLLSTSDNNNRGAKKQRKQTGSDPDIISNVQFLLDFAVVGFGKCGTTTLLQWLQEKAEPSTSGSLVRAPNYEAQFLVNQRPAQLVRKMYQFAIEEQEAREAHKLLPNEKIVKGFKNPSDIRRPKSRALLTKYWPQTPLVVTVRHPVEWLVSIYNYFKIEKGRHSANITATDMLAPGGRDEDGNTPHFVSTAKGEFHAILAEVGKTPLIEDSPEWDLLRPWLNPTHASQLRHHRMPNPIFFMEMKQLADSNTSRAKQFANDLEAFLGLPPNHLPPALHVRPNTDRVKLKTTDHLKMDICRPEFAPVLEEMVSIARSASLWFRQYFIPSPDVTVSSPEYIHELLEAWMVDPCEDKAKKYSDGGSQYPT